MVSPKVLSLEEDNIISDTTLSHLVIKFNTDANVKIEIIPPLRIISRLRCFG
jgi:hypothetical protein